MKLFFTLVWSIVGSTVNGLGKELPQRLKRDLIGYNRLINNIYGRAEPDNQNYKRKFYSKIIKRYKMKMSPAELNKFRILFRNRN